MDEGKTVLFVAPFPPPYTGQTVASEAFATIASSVSRVTRLSLVDPRRLERPSGTFSLSQTLRVARVCRSIRYEDHQDVAYLTLSSSTPGLVRDTWLLQALRNRADRVVAHVHQGSYGVVTSRPVAAPYRAIVSKLVDRFVFLSPSLAAKAAWIPSDLVCTVPNPPGTGVTPSQETVERWIHERTLAAPWRVLFLANMLPGKGHERLLRAIEPLADRLGQRPLRVDFVGGWSDPSEQRDFERRCQRLASRADIRVHGALTDRERVQNLLGAAHALAFPSTYALEGAPIAVVEALASGTPVVASRHAALPDMIDDGVGGIVVDRPDAGPWSDALARVLDRNLWPDLARGARAGYERRFAPELVKEAFLAALFRWPEKGVNDLPTE